MAKIDTTAALLHFKQTDTLMAEMLEKALSATEPLAVPAPKKPTQYFASIVSSIVSQQISVKAADSILRRLTQTLGKVTPEQVLATAETDLRAAGLSPQKLRYLKHNADIWHTLPINDLKHMEDEAVIEELTKLYGIGRWTAEMFLMFSLARPDVFSRGDLGLMQGLYMHYPKVRPHHTRKIAHTIESWGPHRTTAALTLWYHKDNGPVLL